VKIVHYDRGSGKILGFYAPEIHGDQHPTPALEITDTQWQEVLSNPNHWRADDGVLVPYIPPPRPADARRKMAKEAIDRAAGAARQRFVSPGALIDAEYVQAETEAQAYADAGYPVDAAPAAVQSWADAAGMTPQAAAENILATAQQWRGLLNQIRAIRLLGKAAVDAAADADIEATAKAYIDQLDALKPA
jgi:hypothetical protein